MSDNKPVLIALIVTGLALIGIVAYYFSAQEVEPETTTQSVPVEVVPTEEVVETPEPEPVVEPIVAKPIETVPESEPPAFVLPRLDNSDQLIRDGAVSLTRHEGINTWLGGDELIRKTVAFVDNIANGMVARQPAAALAPRGAMIVREIDDGVFEMDERSYDRYNLVTNIFLSLDTERSVEFYLLLKPLFTEAYKELGYPTGDFNEVILRAIGRMLETPDLASPARLVRPVVMYEYEDAQLEALSPAQKQLLRMGPRHATAIKTKLGGLARELRGAVE